MIAIRGATTISSNTSEEIKAASIELIKELFEANNLNLKNITAIFFSCTRDITADYPGKFVREHYSLRNVSIMHFNEMYVENTLPLCIRVLVEAEGDTNSEIKFVYLRGARDLRKDLLP